MSDAIIIEQVTKRFGDKVAVDHLDLRIAEGGLYGFIGPNGAGKSTTIRMVMSIIFPDSGRLSVLGRASAVESKDRIGYLPEERGVYRKMKVAAFIEYMARLKGVDPGPELRRSIGDWLERMDLGREARKKCEELSKGMQQKLQFISCVIHKPDLLILDEPFSGLDPVNRRLLRTLFLEQHERGATVIFSTHQMESAEELCDHIVMIHKGVKRLDATMDQIRTSHEVRRIIVRPMPGDSPAPALERITGVAHVEPVQNGLEAEVAPGHTPSEVMREIAGVLPCRGLELKMPTLEDIFIGIVSEQGESEAEARLALHANKDAAALAGTQAKGD
ncbi:MAG: ATP-binding cassette domain-containing protein [Phycisphaerales bacterium]|nr:ATP-binding cassette domain-containing protein [Phycisphaerales bacterium]